MRWGTRNICHYYIIDYINMMLNINYHDLFVSARR